MANIKVAGAATGKLTRRFVVDEHPVVVDVGAHDLGGPSGVVVALQSEDLNANLVVLEAGQEVQPHRNHEVDVLMVAVSGRAELCIDGRSSHLGADVVALVPKGCERSIRATTRLVYYTVHRCRQGATSA